MDDEVRTRFKEVFEAIRQEFKIVFPNMFGGGKAELVLTEPTDLLKTGIEIEVQPPGKKLQSLSLLSGGERDLQPSRCSFLLSVSVLFRFAS